MLVTDATLHDALVWVARDRERQGGPYLRSLDLETTGLFAWVAGARITTAQMSDGATTLVFPFACDTGQGTEGHPSLFTEAPAAVAATFGTNLTPGSMEKLWEALRGARLVFHQAAFDLGWMRAHGCDIDAVREVYDTKIAVWLLDENADSSLAGQQERWLPDRPELAKLEAPGEWTKLSPVQVHDYAAGDALLTHQIWWPIRTAMAVDPSTQQAYHRELAFLHALERMCARGIAFDADRAFGAAERNRVRIKALMDTLPCDPLSPKQMRRWLYGQMGFIPLKYTSPTRTHPAGQPSTDNEALWLLRAEHPSHVAYPLLAAALEVRHLTKMNSTYLEALPELRDSEGRVHPLMSQCSTVTGRLASTIFQNLPRLDADPDIRACFGAPEGRELWRYDLSQAELRFVADYAEEPTMIELFEQGADLHAEVARELFGSAEGRRRWVSKQSQFARIYGAGAETFASQIFRLSRGEVRVTEDQARAWLGRYNKRFPAIGVFDRTCQMTATKRGYVKLWPEGRRRHNPGKDALNSVIQGGVAELLKEIQLLLDPLLEATHDALIVLQLHDELVVDLPQGKGEVVGETIQHMVDDVSPLRRVRIPVDGRRWP